MRSFIPSLGWLASYQAPWLKADVAAGLTAAAIVIPKAMAYATIAGLPVQVGLYTAFIPMLIYVLLGTSNTLSVSSTTTIAILTGAALGEIAQAQPGTSLITATATLGLLVGAILIAARVLRLGFVANFISDPVLTGFKAGIGLVIVVDQLPKLLGVKIHKEGFFHDVAAIFAKLPDASTITVAVAVATFVVIILFEKFVPRAPAPLVAVGGGVAASLMLALESRGVSLVGAIPGGLPALTLPDPSLMLQLWPAAVGIALMSFTETIAAGRAFVRKGDRRPDAGQELLATGAGNAVGAFFGAMPSGGGTSQSNVNLVAGARTQAAQFATALTTLATMLFLAPVMAAIPNATLAAVVIAYSVGLISPADIAAIRRVRTLEFRWAIAAFAGVVLLGTLKGILVAVVLSMASLLMLANHPAVRILARVPGTNGWRPRTERHPEYESIPGLLIMRPEGRIYFGNASAIGEKLTMAVAEEKPSVLLIDGSAVPGFEYTALSMFLDGDARLREQGVEMWLAELNPEGLDLVRRSALGERLGEARMFRTVEEAVDAYQKRRAA